MYVHELPTTGEIVFSDFLLASSPSLVNQLAHATELRARIRALLKANRSQPTTDWITIVKATEEYLPCLFAIHNCLQTDDLILKYDPDFSWRTCFSAASLIGPPPRIALRGIHYELVSTLLLSGTSLSNLASSLIAALGPSYERDRSLSEADRRQKDDRLKTAADLLARAAGVFEYVASSLIPAWENAVGNIDPRPPESTPELASALSKLALADAQTLAIRKLLSPSVSLAEDTITPGPPLPKSHPSPSLLAKLHLETCALYESAEQLARLAGSKRAVGGGSGGSGGMGLGASASGRVGGSGGRRAIEPPSSLLGNSRVGAGAGAGAGVADSSNIPRGGGALDISDDGSSSHNGPVAGPRHPYSPAGGGGGASGGNKPSRLLHFASRLGNARSSPSPGISSDSPPPPSHPSSSSGGSSSYSHPGITSSLLNYLSTNALFARAQAYRWLAVDTGEGRSAYGEALAYLALARDQLEDGDSSSSSSNNHINSENKKGKLARKIGDLSSTTSTRTKELRSSLRAQSALELRDIAHWTQSYSKLNNTITFYPIPPSADVLSKIPAGRAAVGLKAYVPPTPAFGPGATGGFLSVGMRRLGFGHAEEEEEEGKLGEGEGQGDHAPPPAEGTLLGTQRKTAEVAQYAGAGAYY
ncbi:unnamed protein product [Tilletia controversa]|uniref:pH-response regulator protein palC n=2 Tax=Tilletia TaxID=13289 RepID=A0A8X7SXS9_9BASI|nr:hypothetical protein CF336_g2754 [Tilletia laevis]KAE8201806.1 hypothetical protein CF328_g2577 [Tilletia controversa]KAE8262819.1 hypothetical protein A4X03_0g2153 [Tilletia caries]KAE8203705.1 hypothetical protein CF335_g2922 [Tilletia laevis]KAE8249421.1 hypothetical protein A4X06_0g3239 [Tilletia controversa]